MKRAIVPLIFLLLITLLGCAPGQTPTYLVSGTVYNQQLQPLSGVQVTLGTTAATTTSQGSFLFTNVAQGNYTLYASKSGYQSVTQTVGVYSNITNLTVQMTPAAETGHTLQIYISDVNGPSVTNATTRLTNLSNNQVMGSTTANPAVFTGLATSDYRIEITHSSYQTYTATVTVNNNLIHTASLQPKSASASGTVSFGSNFSSLQSAKRVEGKTFPLPASGTAGAYDGILVQFREYTDKNRMNQALSRVQSKSMREKGHGMYHLQVTGNPDDAMALLRQNPDVEEVQLNYVNQLAAVPNDAYYSYQWNLDLIHMSGAWDHVKGQNGNIVVAVLDTGIRSHSDLAANIVPGYDPVNNDSDPYDDVSTSEEGSHGTHVASIIGAVTNNNSLLSGVGWNIRVMPVKVFSRSAAGLGATDSDVAEGIYWAVDRGADVINLSLGNHTIPSPSSHSVFESALRYAYEHGVTIVAATGNEGSSYVNYPASSPYTIAVGAVGHDQIRTSYSNYGTGIDLVAPGGHGASNTNNQWVRGYNNDNGNEEVIYMVGTSQAAPHVSAVAGLLYTLGVTDPDQILEILVDSATNKYDTTHYGAGILDAEAAVLLAANQQPSVPITSARIFAATMTEQGGTITIQPVSATVSPNADGSYTVTGVETGLSGIYIVGIIDFNQNSQLDEGDYFGQTQLSYTFSGGEHKTGLHFQIYPVPYTASHAKQQTMPHYVLAKQIP